MQDIEYIRDKILIRAPQSRTLRTYNYIQCKPHIVQCTVLRRYIQKPVEEILETLEPAPLPRVAIGAGSNYVILLRRAQMYHYCTEPGNKGCLQGMRKRITTTTVPISDERVNDFLLQQRWPNFT